MVHHLIYSTILLILAAFSKKFGAYPKPLPTRYKRECPSKISTGSEIFMTLFPYNKFDPIFFTNLKNTFFYSSISFSF